MPNSISVFFYHIHPATDNLLKKGIVNIAGLLYNYLRNIGAPSLNKQGDSV